MVDGDRGLGKCVENHGGAYGYPSRPAARFDFCSRCGNRMVWECPACGEPLPEDAEDLELARFCRQCGASYFEKLPDGSPRRATGD